jgi:hypothetical protein
MNINITPTPDDIVCWMEIADTNKDGKVSIEEFEDLIIKSLEE